MRRQKYYFDFKFGISVKFRFEWYVTWYDSFRICLCLSEKLKLRRREDILNLGNVGKFHMNHIKLHIIRSGILRWFRIWSQNNIFAYAFKRKSRLKKFAWANPKNFYSAESAVKFWLEIYPYVTWSKIITPRIADVLKIEFYRLL